MPTIYAELSVTSKNTNLQELSKITGLSPSRLSNINDVTKRGIVLSFSSWDYETNIFETYNSEDVSPHLIIAFKDSIDKFIDFIQKNNCKVSICYVIGDVIDIMPTLSIDREMIHFAAKLNAEVYFDGNTNPPLQTNNAGMTYPNSEDKGRFND